MMCRASIASSRVVTCVPGSGRPFEFVNTDFVEPDLRARVRSSFAPNAVSLPASAFGEHDAGVVGGLNDHAVQQVVDRDPAVDRREHGRAVRRRAALSPGVLADHVTRR